MPSIKHLDHLAVITADKTASLAFYCDVLGFRIQDELYRADKDSWRVDLTLNGQYLLELFTFPSPPPRPSYPEACGLRHMAFAVENLAEWEAHLTAHQVRCESIRQDELTGKRFLFCFDPDNLPVEFYER